MGMDAVNCVCQLMATYQGIVTLLFDHESSSLSYKNLDMRIIGIVNEDIYVFKEGGL